MEIAPTNYFTNICKYHLEAMKANTLYLVKHFTGSENIFFLEESVKIFPGLRKKILKKIIYIIKQ